MKGISPGIVDFKKAIETSYYVDKSQFIEHAFQPEVCLFTRPRRFGKTLNMSMLKYFFDVNEKDNAYLFDGLKITENDEIMKYQNTIPVISMTLKGIEGEDFATAMSAYADELLDFVSKHQYLLNDRKINEYDHKLLKKYQMHEATLNELRPSLKNLSRMLDCYHGQPVMILIDEYDVPLRAAYENGYYDKMVDFLRSLLGGALKDNDYLFKGVLTGCLRIARESIFTGLNNFSVFSIFDEITAEDFGFTASEVDEILRCYHLEDKKEDIKDWYDGYCFGDHDIYNPWSVLQFLYKAIKVPKAEPISYWANSSGNDIVYDYIKNGDDELKDEFSQLVQGKSITKTIMPELTYREMDDIENIYSFLLFSGYLKSIRQVDEDTYELMIPNKEVKIIYKNQFDKWFKKFKRDNKKDFSQAVFEGNVDTANIILNYILANTLSFYDTNESFYHGLLIGLLKNDRMSIESNRESGNGRFDILMMMNKSDALAIVIECKVAASSAHLKQTAEKALKQIEEKHYDQLPISRNYKKIIRYGIAFYKKECQILMK